MSKAEERALEKYPLMEDDDKEGLEALKYIGMECECASVFNEVQEAKQAYFIEGYQQAEIDIGDPFEYGYIKAEKDLELTWKDMELIYEISCDVFNEQDGHFYNVSKIWEEILKRFKEML